MKTKGNFGIPKSYLHYFISLYYLIGSLLYSKKEKNYIFEIEEGTTLVIHFLYLYGLGDMILT